jgi:hypothetical protein
VIHFHYQSQLDRTQGHFADLDLMPKYFAGLHESRQVQEVTVYGAGPARLPPPEHFASSAFPEWSALCHQGSPSFVPSPLKPRRILEKQVCRTFCFNAFLLVY